MKRGIFLLLTVALCAFFGLAHADDYGEAIIDASGGWAYLYEESSSRSEALGQYLTGTSVELRSEVLNGWVEVKIGRERGWMNMNDLVKGSAAKRVKDQFWTGEVKATKYARMRKGPSTEYQFIRNVNDGETVTIMGKTDEDWYYVAYKGDEGFISKNLIYTRGSFGKKAAEEDDGSNWVETPVHIPTAAPVYSWYDAYTNYLMKNGGENDTYALIYVNDDNVPELVIDSGVEASGCRILTYAGGRVNVLTTRRLGFTYIPRGNRLSNSDGSMDSYFDDIYEIRDGLWVCVARGEYYGYLSGWNDILKRYVCQHYVWNGQKTDIGQYMVRLSQVYDSQRAVGVEEGLSKNSILWKIGEMR